MNTSTDSLVVDDATDGHRVDHLLATHFPEHSRSYIQRLFKDGVVCVNGLACKKSRSLKTGDVIDVAWPDVKPFELLPEEIPFPILFEDDSMLVIDKPAGLTVHPGAGQHDGTLVNALLAYDHDRFSSMVDDHMERPGIVHRLDKDTTGALVVGKTRQVTAALSAAFANRTVHKTYLAICHGSPVHPAQKIDNYIDRHPTQRKRMAVVSSGGKRAISTYKVLDQSDSACVVRVTIETGRTHQIRVHMKAAGHAIVGDTVYHQRKQSTIDAPRQMLHAWRLEFPHPLTSEPCRFQAPVPEDFMECARSLGLDMTSLDSEGLV
jgi:23S rRNA pseudouridine1911/1915/1917 synthase